MLTRYPQQINITISSLPTEAYTVLAQLSLRDHAAVLFRTRICLAFTVKLDTHVLE